MKYIIKPFSEIIVKSKPVRKKYMSILQTNISLSVKELNENIKIHFAWDKLEISIPDDLDESLIIKLNEKLSFIPWIESFLKVVEFDFLTLDQIWENSIKTFNNRFENNSFVVRVKRTWNHDFKSIDAERYIWWYILKSIASTKVDLHNPWFILNIEIKDKRYFLVTEKFIWIWWFPVWAQDKVISLISGWFDSTVSTFSMMKRWCKVDFLFFNLWWKAHELWVKEVSNFIRQNFSKWYSAKFITIPFEDIMNYLAKNINHRYRWIILKRLFLKTADILAKENTYYAIIKWDSLWQVSSQTLKNINVIDKASETVVLRPLISFNKQEIINQSKIIWTYEFACSMPEYCGAISHKPATWAKLEDILEEELKFPIEMLLSAIESKKVESITKVLEKENNWNDEIEIIHIPTKKEIIIDVREEPVERESPLKISVTKVLKIPFFDTVYDFEKLDQSKKYILYCDKWIMSKNIAIALKEKWFNNVWIFRPFENSSFCQIKLEN